MSPWGMKKMMSISNAPETKGQYASNPRENSRSNMNKVVPIREPKKIPSPPITMYMRQ